MIKTTPYFEYYFYNYNGQLTTYNIQIEFLLNLVFSLTHNPPFSIIIFSIKSDLFKK